MLFDRVADLPVVVDGVDLLQQERDTTSGFARATTTVALSGAGETGKGEDVTYETELHHELAEAGLPDLTGEYTFAEFSTRVGELDLFPSPPEREDFRHYRRWGVESAALDLALRQADTDLASALDRTYDPVEFVVSTRLGEPPTTDRLEAVLDVRPDTEFKLDPTTDWTAELAESVADLAPVRICDLKGQYSGTVVDAPPDPDLYELVLNAYPEAVVEDPNLTDETRPLFEGREGRVSWDAPITGVASIEALPFEPDWLNIKPSRFGSVESLFEAVEYCEDHDIQMYGGGQFELGVGRGHIQALAALFYPESPNDVAPGGYNDPDFDGNLSPSPLEPPGEPAGFRWP
ncbi:enolase [Halorientalis sp. IM1011]|uniref:enolase n=1 Tax=Halorientalis sp. IM1011 TaxID=1932360 RepID=UPI00097CC8F3|nr:enolase [Halorientalis sp. IM1011]AQL43193.1 enolase [Halorientalis sp. IM1011]